MRRPYWYVSMILPPLILAGGALWLWQRWDGLPEVVPVRFNAAGEAYAWGDRWMLWAMLGLGLVLFLALLAAHFFPQTWRMRGIRPEEREAALPLMAATLADYRITVALLMVFITVWSALNAPGSAWVQNAATGVLVFFPILRYSVRLYLLRR